MQSKSGTKIGKSKFYELIHNFLIRPTTPHNALVHYHNPRAPYILAVPALVADFDWKHESFLGPKAPGKTQVGAYYNGRKFKYQLLSGTG